MEDPPASGLGLYLDQDMSEPQSHTVAGGVAIILSARCPGKDTPNEDAAAVIPLDEHSAVLAVADGMGGSPVGERASSLAIRTLRDNIAQGSENDQSYRSAILNGIEAANHAVRALGVGAATTLAVAELCDNQVRPYHVGDSMILSVGQKGKIKLQTISHSPVGFAVEAGHLDEAEAMRHEDRHIVSNVVGSAEMRIDVGPTLKLARRDTVLLATDGLFDNLYNDEIVGLARKGPIEKAAGALATEAQARMLDAAKGLPSKPDDLSVILFRRLA